MPRKFSVLGDEPYERKDVEAELRRSLQDRRQDDGVSYHLQDIQRGVSVAWLATVFGMDPYTVKKRLADCPPVERKKQGYRYSVSQAAAFLVKPVFDEEKFIKSMKPNELPPKLQVEFWTAMEKRIKYKVAAGELWYTEDVLEAFSQVFVLIKTSMQLWPDNIARQLKIPPKGKDVLAQSVDILLAEVYEQLTDLDKQKQTFPVVEDEDEIVGDET